MSSVALGLPLFRALHLSYDAASLSVKRCAPRLDRLHDCPVVLESTIDRGKSSSASLNKGTMYVYGRDTLEQP